MSNNPVQIVLNTQNYVVANNKPPGGGNKDFYAGRDEDFKDHKQNLIEEIQYLRSSKMLKDNEVIYATVELQSAAWAKSHKPTTKLFPLKKVRSIGGNELGRLIVELSEEDLHTVELAVMSAEEETNWGQDKNGKPVAKPSVQRSEVGAISTIRAYSTQERRNFTIEQAWNWLSDTRTGGAYYIETFYSADFVSQTINDKQKSQSLKLLRKFKASLDGLDIPITVTEVNKDWLSNTFFVIKMNRPNGATLEDHESLLAFLDNSQIVRSIFLPPILQASNESIVNESVCALNLPQAGKNYPVVGIIDSGVADLDALNSWSIGSSDFVFPNMKKTDHGTFIAGLVSAGKELNSLPELEESECKFYDLGIYPDEKKFSYYYPNGFIDFLEQLEIEIADAVSQGVRIFNMSLSVETLVEDTRYSFFANTIDQICDKYDVIFVLPAGNLDQNTVRKPWPSTDKDALQMLAEYRHSGKDRIFQPADSLRSITVGALDPSSITGHVKPAQYTRKGPGPSYGAKPDIAHVGGGLAKSHGLFSISPDGNLCQGCGTSYAAPLVAKTLAALDFAIEGKVPRETLSGLLLHNSEVPQILQTKNLKRIAKDYVGVGLPQNASSSLLLNNHEITMVFNGEIGHRQQMVFDFAWPSCLVTPEGKCLGSVKITTVYRPPIERENGAEFVLVNINTWLRQAKIDKDTGNISYRGMIRNEKADSGLEKERIAQGAKWWPIKQSNDVFVEGVGQSSQCRLVVEPLTRADYVIKEPIPFSAIVTISDPNQVEDVFNAVRSQLQSEGVQLSDIRTALRPRLKP
ncbi:S8 family peptidase [Acinetobacter seifertii]|uniref:S8 family peptidase n=1 Tax=Acinetobacter seifertii TaxID=1530123 RepID=UPI000C223459|nr:S8 family peptidase [Acinetobacter seifertii]PJG65498.1 hypothetical protein CVD09_15830 [Acinetobacter seifertii]